MITPSERLWDKIERGEDNECWMWLAGTNRAGDGILSISKGHETRTVIAHRMAWEEIHGRRAPARLYRTCGTPGCCNPAHYTPYKHELLRLRKEERKLEPPSDIFDSVPASDLI